MKYKNILLTGASGRLGQAIVSSSIFKSLLTPEREILDITKPETIKRFFDEHDIDAVIHCAALARMKECEEDSVNAIATNIIGTSNLVNVVLKNQGKSKSKIRFLHISTDGVYESTKGNYSEKDETIPYNKYGWTKLGAECAVNLLPNFCIIRTRFFDPKHITFEDAATDAYDSKVPVAYLAKAIAILLESDFIGTINVGSERKSDYDTYKEFKPSIRPCKFSDLQKKVSFNLSKDASMDCSLWKKIEQKNKNK
jgi:dTDP-4-dehydrorhamnose reductase